MPKKKQGQLAPLEKWLAVQLRLTAFPDSAIDIQDSSWWEELIGEPPESRTHRPKAEELKEDGEFESGKLILNCQPGRIDWFYTISLPDELPVEIPQTIEEFPKAQKSFLQLMQKWIERNCPKLGRIAFGAVLLLPVESRQEGYMTLSNYLPDIQLDTEGASDFMYQINRPRDSRLNIPGLQINRLSKWSVATHILSMMQINAKSGRTEKLSRPAKYSCRLELDINTSQDYNKPFNQEQIKAIFIELVELAKEIVAKGDIK
jgi:hypothetical protein